MVVLRDRSLNFAGVYYRGYYGLFGFFFFCFFYSTQPVVKSARLC